MDFFDDHSSNLNPLRKLHYHLRDAKAVLNKGYSQDHLDEWLDSGKANGGVVGQVLFFTSISGIYHVNIFSRYLMTTKNTYECTPEIEPM